MRFISSYTYFLLYFFFFSFSTARASELDMSQFIQLLQKHDPQYQSIFADEKSAEYIVEKGLPNSQLLLSLEQENGYTSRNGNTSDFSTSLNKDFVKTGTSVSASYMKSKQIGTNINLTQLRVEQSLLNNSFGRDTRLQEAALEQERDYTLLQVQENYEDYLVTNLGTFLDFKQSYQSMILAQKIYDEALKLEKNIKSRYQARVATSTDMARGELLVLERQEDYLDQKRSFEEKRKSIEALIGNSLSQISPAKNGNIIKILEKLMEKADRIEPDKTRLYIIAEKTESVKNKEYTLAQRDGNPSLSVVAGFNRDESSRYNATANRNETVVGVKLEIPLFDDQQKANTASIGVEKYKAELNKRKAMITYRNEVRDLKDKINTLKMRVKIGRKKIQVTKKILDDEQKRYKIGKVDLEGLIDTVNDFATSRIDLNSNEVEYAKSMIQWLGLNDQLISASL